MMNGVDLADGVEGQELSEEELQDSQGYLAYSKDEDLVTVVPRQDQAALRDEELLAYRNAIMALVAEGTHRRLQLIFADKSHNMHAGQGMAGLHRFLPWNRRYLLEMERELQRVDKVLRPDATAPLGLPYWKWQDPFPVWLEDFLPPGARPRKNAPPPDKSTADDIDIIVNHFRHQRPFPSPPVPYAQFAWGAEGRGRKLNGTSLPGLNHGHHWIGGVMASAHFAPFDPVFWLHRANADRLWEIWRLANPTEEPVFEGANNIMDPWPESYNELLDTSALGYSYDSLEL